MRFKIICFALLATCLTACASNDSELENTTTQMETSTEIESVSEPLTEIESISEVESVSETTTAVVTEPIDKLYLINGELIHLPATLEDMGDKFSFGLYPSFGENTVSNEFCYKGELIAIAISDKYESIGEGDREVNIYNIYDFAEGVDIKEIDRGENINSVIEKIGEPIKKSENVYSFELDGRVIDINVKGEEIIGWSVEGGVWYE